MTSWRDARLKRALEDAPDREALPQERTRHAIRDFAHKAVAAPVVVAAPWWKKLRPDTGAAHMPWNAALATVALATLVTVLWHDEPIPGAGMESPRADRAATTQVAPPVSRPSPQVATTAPIAAPASPPPEAAANLPQPPRPRIAADKNTAKAPPAEPPRERRAEATDSLRDSQERALSKSASGQAATGPARSDTVAEAAPPAAAAAPRAFGRPASPAPTLSAQTAAPSRAEWTYVRIESAGRTIELPRDQAAQLVTLLNSIERAARTQPVLDAPVTTRIELRTAGGAAEIVELGGGRVRWRNVLGGVSEMVTVQPDPARLQAVQAEVDRVLGR